MAFSSNPMFSTENLLTLSGNILAAPNLASGIGSGFQQVGQNLTVAKEKQKIEEVRNKTADMLATEAPEIAEMVRSGALTASDGYKTYLEQRKAAAEASRPDYQFLQAGDRVLLGDKSAGTLKELGNYSSPKTSAEYQDYLLQQQDPNYAAAREAERNAKNAPSTKDNFESEQTLWKNWRSDADVKEYQGVRNGYEKIRASAVDPTGPKDLGIIFGYMKMLDPTSVVREGEQASVANSGGVPQQIMNWYNKALTGEQLPPKVRDDILKAAEGLYQESAKNYESVNEQVRNMAERYNVDPQFITPAEKYEPLKVGQKIQTTVGGKPVTIERVPE